MHTRKILALATVIVTLLILTPLAASRPPPPQPLQATVLHVAPSSTTAVLGNSYTIYINVTDVEDLYAYEFQFEYDPAILDLTSATPVTGALNGATQTFQQYINETAGHIWWAESSFFPTTTGLDHAEQSIFEIQFDALATGTSNLGLFSTILSHSNATAISHTVANGTITVYNRDLSVTAINVLDQGGSIYANDSYAAGALYYYPVEVDIDNAGNLAAGQFNVSLEVYSINDSVTVDTEEILVTNLAAGTSTTVNFTNLFHVNYTGFYRLIATVDSQSEVSEDNEANNGYTLDNIMVTVMGDINGDRVVNILDAVVMAQAWDGIPGAGQWNPLADLNHDKDIDILDGVRIGANWGRTW